MSEAFFETGGLRFWREAEIDFREYAIRAITHAVKGPLETLNRGWTFVRCECPSLVATSRLSGAYTGDDVFLLQAKIAGHEFCLRPETTPTSYEVARRLMQRGGEYRPPLCVWQAGKSFRRELSDGATAAKLRFNEFWQVEFQCIYSIGTKADYRTAVIPTVKATIAGLTCAQGRVVPSERTPLYSRETLDIEIQRGADDWCEVASISIRTDFAPDMEVLEVAIGLDRIVAISFKE